VPVLWQACGLVQTLTLLRRNASLPIPHVFENDYFLKIVRILSWDSDSADWYAEIRHQLVSTGQPIGELGMMIAAHSLSVGSVLVTNNTRHFQRIKAPLFLENWI
jgi:predicted nucleic acid-binding protein